MAEAKDQKAVAVAQRSEIVYVPLGERGEIKLSTQIVNKFLCRPTRSGQHPDEQEVMKFMMLCRARELNPFTGDAFLVGYDSKDGPQFALITAIQAMYKRAEVNPNYDGIESGAIVKNSAGELVERQGDFLHPGDVLLGGWARVFLKNMSHPVLERLNLESRDKNRSVWNTDKSGMIVKCAEAAALRRAFPGQLSGMYAPGEIVEGNARVIAEIGTTDVETVLGKGVETTSQPGGSAETAPQPKTGTAPSLVDASYVVDGHEVAMSPDDDAPAPEAAETPPPAAAPVAERSMADQVRIAWGEKLKELKGIDPDADLVDEQLDAFCVSWAKMSFAEVEVKHPKWLTKLLADTEEGRIRKERFDFNVNPAPEA